jgi:hypothetical protein
MTTAKYANMCAALISADTDICGLMPGGKDACRLRQASAGGARPLRMARPGRQSGLRIFRQEQLMRLEPLYRIRFTYPESWAVGLDGGWQQMFFIAEGRCEGSVTGRFRGANFPRKEGADGPFRPDFRAVIETGDGAVIMVEWHG